jgi:hypothetical protein
VADGQQGTLTLEGSKLIHTTLSWFEAASRAAAQLGRA